MRFEREERRLENDTAVVILTGVEHNVLNTSPDAPDRAVHNISTAHPSSTAPLHRRKTRAVAPAHMPNWLPLTFRTGRPWFSLKGIEILPYRQELGGAPRDKATVSNVAMAYSSSNG